MIGQRLLSLIETDYLETVGQALLLEIIGFYLTLRYPELCSLISQSVYGFCPVTKYVLEKYVLLSLTLILSDPNLT